MLCTIINLYLRFHCKELILKRCVLERVLELVHHDECWHGEVEGEEEEADGDDEEGDDQEGAVQVRRSLPSLDEQSGHNEARDGEHDVPGQEELRSSLEVLEVANHEKDDLSPPLVGESGLTAVLQDLVIFLRHCVFAGASSSWRSVA